MRPHYLTLAAKLNRAMRLRQQQGASLVVSLLMLVAVLLLGISAAQIALQGEKSSRNDRDRQIAFQAAEAALLDAEMDIEGKGLPDPSKSRSALFSEKSSSINFVAGCGARDGNKNLGLCVIASPIEKPVWLLVDFTDENPTSMKSVPFGKFTGQILQTGNGPLPSKSPRYIIEEVPYNLPGSVPGEKFYRITAMGFGARETTQAVLQSFYRKIDQ